MHLKLFFLTVLESGAPLSSFLEEVLYKSLNEWMNEWIYYFFILQIVEIDFVAIPNGGRFKITVESIQ